MYFGIDYGLARSGVARSDGMNMLASPVEVIKNPDGGYKPVIRALRRLLDQSEYQLEGVVLGYPDESDERAAAVCAEVLRLKGRLEQALRVPVYLQDEMFSSRRAAERLRQSGKKGARLAVDAHAAAVILQDWLDSRENPGQ